VWPIQAGLENCGVSALRRRGYVCVALRRSLSGMGVPISELVRELEVNLYRPVMNKTGLKGLFDIAFTVEISTDFSDPSVTSDQPPLYSSALEKQLGLKLKSFKAPVEAIVIDSISKPSAG